MGLLACDSHTLTDCAHCLLARLELIFKDESSEKVIYAHSMGAMLLIKIFLHSHDFSSFEQDLLEKVFKSRIIFIQAPIKTNFFPYHFYMNFRAAFIAVMRLYRSLFYVEIETILIRLKKTILKAKTRSYNVAILDLFLNLALMGNSALGTEPQEFYNLIEYYKEWNDFHFIDHITDDIRETDYSNFYFTYGQPDMFEDKKKLEFFAAILGAQLVHLPWGFHSPQHLFWWQNKLNSLAEV